MPSLYLNLVTIHTRKTCMALFKKFTHEHEIDFTSNDKPIKNYNLCDLIHVPPHYDVLCCCPSLSPERDICLVSAEIQMNVIVFVELIPSIIWRWGGGGTNDTCLTPPPPPPLPGKLMVINGLWHFSWSQQQVILKHTLSWYLVNRHLNAQCDHIQHSLVSVNQDAVVMLTVTGSPQEMKIVWIECHSTHWVNETLCYLSYRNLPDFLQLSAQSDHFQHY